MLWGEVYPFCEFENDIKNKEMHVIEDEKKIIGSFVLSEFDDPEYQKIEWQIKGKKLIYINRLVILPTEQGKGFAKKIMNVIENHAINNNYESMRLTVHKDNINAIRLYEKYNFIKVEKGNWTLDNQIFWGFEKEVNKNLET